MNRSFVVLALATLATGCAAASTGGSPGAATEGSLMQADRDFADATQQIYLGMNSFHQMRDAYWRKRLARRKATQKGAT